MKSSTFAHLVTAMDAIISRENEDRDGVVYESLGDDMARAAKLVYDAALKAQSYAKDESERTTR